MLNPVSFTQSTFPAQVAASDSVEMVKNIQSHSQRSDQRICIDSHSLERLGAFMELGLDSFEGWALLEMMQHPCRGCSQTFSDPCIILICASLGGYICSLENPLRRTSPLIFINSNRPSLLPSILDTRLSAAVM